MRRRGDGRAGGGFAGYRGGGGGGERGALPPSADRLPPPRACRRPPAASLRPSASGWRSLARRVKGCASLRTNADEAGDSSTRRARAPPAPRANGAPGGRATRAGAGARPFPSLTSLLPPPRPPHSRETPRRSGFVGGVLPLGRRPFPARGPVAGRRTVVVMREHRAPARHHLVIFFFPPAPPSTAESPPLQNSRPNPRSARARRPPVATEAPAGKRGHRWLGGGRSAPLSHDGAAAAAGRAPRGRAFQHLCGHTNGGRKPRATFPIEAGSGRLLGREGRGAGARSRGGQAAAAALEPRDDGGGGAHHGDAQQSNPPRLSLMAP